MTARGPRPGRGMGLPEVMVSLAILGLMGTLIFGTFQRVMATRTRAERVGQRYHQLAQALGRMNREIGSAFLSQHCDRADPRTQTLFWGRRAEGGGRLDFTSFAHVRLMADAKQSDQSEIGYYLGPDPQEPGRQHLYRREKPRLDERRAEGGEAQVMVEDVESLSFRYYNARADTWADEWDDLVSDQRNLLPKVVRVEVGWREGQARQKLVTRVRLFVQQAVAPTGFGAPWCRP